MSGEYFLDTNILLYRYSEQDRQTRRSVPSDRARKNVRDEAAKPVAHAVGADAGWL